MISLDIHEAVGILESISCGEDPIYYKGNKESNPIDISNQDPEPHRRASKIRISYWNQRGKLVRGSLFSMVKDRLGLQQHVRKRRRVPQTKTYRLYDWGSHGSGIIYFDIIKQIEDDTKVKFTFPSDVFEDYQLLIEAIASQLRDERFRCTTYADDDIEITILL